MTAMPARIQDHSDFHLIDRAFAHVAQKLAFLWGSPEFHGFVEQLEQDTRQGARAGFPADVLFALARLSLAHDEAFPELAKAKPTVWSQSNFR